MSKYLEIYNQMEEDIWYTAKELRAAPATMTALVNRGLAERDTSTPRNYRKISNNIFIKIKDILTTTHHTTEYFTLYKKDEKLGMMCSLKNDKILDCYGNNYSLDNVIKIQIKKDFFDFN